MPTPPTTDLTTGEVAAMLGVHTSTVKRWFREAAPPARGPAAARHSVATTSGGHRRIPLDFALGVARRRGHRIGLHRFGAEAGRVWVATRALATGDPDPALGLLMEWLRSRRAPLVGRLLRHLTGVAAANRRAAEGRLTRTDPAILDSVFGGFLRRVGDGWANGELRISDERAGAREVAETVHALLQAVEEARASREGDDPAADPKAPLTPPAPHPRTAIVATVESDQHILGSLLARLVLAQRGWRTEHLGTGLPITEIVATQQLLGASLVCVSFVPPRGPADVHRFANVAARLSDPRRPWALVVGGAGTRGATLPPPGGPFTHTAALDSLVDLDEWLGGYEEKRQETRRERRGEVNEEARRDPSPSAQFPAGDPG